MARHVQIPAFEQAITYSVTTAQSEFAIPFPFWAAADIIVEVDGVALATSAYTVAGLFVQDGDPVEGAYGSGTVTLDEAVENCTVTIDRLVEAIRETDFAKTGAFSINTLNSDLDKLTARDQDLKRRVLANEAALDALPEVAFSAVSTSESVAAPDLEAALQGAAFDLYRNDADLTLQLGAGTTSIPSPIGWDHSQSSKIKVRGQTPLDLNIVSIDSVTGSAGAWSVTATLDDASGVSVGDGLLIRDVVPGWAEPGAYAASTMVPGEFRMMFFAVGSVTTSGTAATLTGSAGTTYLQDGDIVCIAGETRSISSVGASGFTLNAALTADLTSALQYWYALAPLTGTITCSGTTVTGTGTDFDGELNVGDIIFPVGHGPRMVTAIDSDTSLTVDKAITIGSGVAFGSMACGWRHEGAFIVTAVSGDQVTWTNYNRTDVSKPPVNGISGGSVTVCTSVLSATSSAFEVGKGQVLDVDDVVIVGPTTTTTVAIDLRGVDGISDGHVRCGANVGIVGFGYGIWGGVGSSVYADDLYCGGQTTRGVSLATGVTAHLRDARISGTSGIGLFVGDGAYARFNAGIVVGASSDGIRMEVGGAGWFDFSASTHHGARGYRHVGGVNIHNVGAWAIGNTSNGVHGENGGYGRASGLLSLCNATGVTIAKGSLEAQYCWLAGNTHGGSASGGAGLRIDEGAASFNSADNVQAIGGGTVVSMDRGRSIGAVDDGLNASDQGRIRGVNAVFGSNGTDGEALTGGRIELVTPTGFTTGNITLNTTQANGSIISTGDAAIDYVMNDATVDGDLTVAGGLSLGATPTEITQIRRYSQTINPTNVVAGGTSDQTFTVAGLVASDQLIFNPIGAPAAGIVVGPAWASGSNTMTVRFANVTASDIDPAGFSAEILAFSL